MLGDSGSGSGSGSAASVIIEELQRFDNEGHTINWTVRETGASFKQDGETYTVAEKDMNVQFNITAKTQTGTNSESGDPEYKTVKVSGTEAAIDTLSSTSANLTFNNEMAPLKKVKVEKKWYDANGDDVTASKTDDDAVYFDLYRTTEELPKGGKPRETFEIVPLDTGAAKRVKLNDTVVEAAEGDELDIHVKSLIKASWGNKWAYHFAGLDEYYSGHWIYAFPITGLFDAEGNDISHLAGQNNELTISESKDNGIFTVRKVSYWSSYEEIIIRVKVEHLEYRPNGSNHNKFAIRYYNIFDPEVSPSCEIEVVNHTQEVEALNNKNLQKIIDSHPDTTELFRDGENHEGIRLNSTEDLWKYIEKLPKEDSEGNTYNYFALERTPAGYDAGYSIEDDEEGNSLITIENRPVVIDDEDPNAYGTLKVSKKVEGLPAGTYSDKEYSFRIRNGAKYLVNMGTAAAPDYQLKSLAQMTTAGKHLQDDATFTIKAGDANGMEFPRLIPAIYTIEEVVRGEVPAGYDLEVSYTGGGKVGVSGGFTKNAVITNTYVPEKTDVTFGKIWADKDSKPVVWPDDQPITVTLHRSVKGETGTEDSDFSIKYVINKETATSGDTSTPKLTITPTETRIPQTEVVTPEIEAVLDSAGSPYYAYQFKITGLSKKVLSGTHAGSEWVYYVKETPGDSYTAGYGTLAGTSVNKSEGKSHAEAKTDPELQNDEEFVINQFASRSISFTKNWFDGVHVTKLDTWPQREVQQYDSDGNLIHSDTPEYEDIPISVTIKRKLSYGVPGTLTDYDPDFSLSFTGLKSTALNREQGTDEGKVTLTMTPGSGLTSGDFVYEVSGLREKGTLDGHEGDWEYFIIESGISGYGTVYEDQTPSLINGNYVRSGGTIKNTKTLGTINVTKKVSGLPDLDEYNNKEYSVQITNADGKYLQQDGILSDTEYSGTVKKGSKLIFRNVPAGSYTVTETGTGEDGSAQVYGYTLAATVTGGGAVSIADDDVKNITITNAYAKDVRPFTFTKEWYYVDHSVTSEWALPAIYVELNSSFKSGSDEVTGEPISMKLSPSGGVSSGYSYSVEKVEKGTPPQTVYEISIEGLDKWVPKSKLPDGVSKGEWTYTLAETVPAGYNTTFIKSNGSVQYNMMEWVDDGGTIQNKLSGYEMPTAGGPGTHWIYLLGSFLIIICGTILTASKRAAKKPKPPDG